jgi:cell division cycle protein 37
MFRHYDDTQKFLEEHLELVCEETANYLVVWCIDLEMEEVKHELNSIVDDNLRHDCIRRNTVLWNMSVIKR